MRVKPGVDLWLAPAENAPDLIFLARQAMIRAVVTVAFLFSSSALAAEKPNIVFILADDLGYGDLGCFGQTKIKTPNLDRMAAEGLRFTQFYAGSTVCAPSRCALMTGRHTGHCRVRGNGGGGGPNLNVALKPEDHTVAELLKSADYATGLVGKWGLGEDGSTGVPTRKGFDSFFGFLNQHHAHDYYPDFLWRDTSRVPMPENVHVAPNVAKERVTYASDLFAKEALAFVDAHRTKPFFLYFAVTAPHANNERTRFDGHGNEVPDYGEYAKTDWPDPEKGKAAMITRLDADIGRLLAKLKELGLENKTLVIFTSDNGPHKEGGNDPAFFRSSGPLRGIKRAMTEGGIRVPTIARWPQVIKPGVSDHVGAFWDVLPTLADIVAVPIPANLDGISFAPTLMGKPGQKQHEYLYWEFHEGGSKQAVRSGDWKGIRQNVGGPLQLYDLANDIGEAKNVAAQHPGVVAKLESYLNSARSESEHWPLKAAPPAKAKGK
ncbi:MAG: arylsulfatase [Gemmataceae bacterium]